MSIKTLISRSKMIHFNIFPQIVTRKVIYASFVAICAICYILWYIIVYSQFPADDAYIHMRIARSFAEQGVPYFNPDQVVGGSSSIFWLLLITAIFRFVGIQPQILSVITSLFTLGIFGACTLILSDKYTLLVSLCLSFFLVVIAVVNTAALIMETPAALFFWLVSIICVQRKSFVWAGVFAGLSFATRYEFSIWLVFIVLTPSMINQRIRIALGALIPTSSIVLFNLYFFHALLPNTVRAKSIIYSLSLNTSLASANISTGVFAFCLLVVLHIIVITYILKKDKQVVLAGMLGFGLVVICLYIVQKLLVFAWYIPIFLFPLLLSYCLCFKSRNDVIRLAMIVLGLAFATFPLVQSFRKARGLLVQDSRFYRDYWSGSRVKQYLVIGHELAEQYPHASLMASEIGGLGWSFPGRIIDAEGLVSPECLKYHPLSVPAQRSSGDLGAIPPQAVRDLHPDLIVSMEVFSEALRRDIATKQIADYTLLRNYPVLPLGSNAGGGNVMLWGSHWTQVFIRR